MRKFGLGCAMQRLKSGSQVKDLWYYLVCHFPQQNVTLKQVSNLFIVGWSWSRKSKTLSGWGGGRWYLRRRCGVGYHCFRLIESILVFATQSSRIYQGKERNWYGIWWWRECPVDCKTWSIDLPECLHVSFPVLSETRRWTNFNATATKPWDSTHHCLLVVLGRYLTILEESLLLEG